MQQIEQRIRPWLWFVDQAEDAANFYVATFENSKITSVSRYGEAGPGPAGSVMVVTFELDGVAFMALNGGTEAEYSSAFYVDCETQAEVDRLWEKLGEGGEPGQCGWIKDRFGVTWNVVPSGLSDLIGSDDEEKAERAMQAMLKMTKLDINALQAAYDGR
ncbi:MAG: VOC family protein [Candidatus Eremiobacteraeota bacterium]|nr:VOC family protein [Candidatus Eremiobacteraeota bacterium]